jgi:hypothetical protein
MTMQTLIKKMALCLFLNMGLTFCFVIAQEALLRQGSEGQDEIEEVEEVTEAEESEGLGDVSAEKSKELDEMEEESGAETEELSEDVVGVQGNWVKKNKWLKDANEKNDKLQVIVLEVQKITGMFYDKFKEIDDIQDDFYRAGGFDRGGITKLFTELEKEVEENKKKDLEILAQGKKVVIEGKKGKVDAYAIEEEFDKYKKELEQLKLDMESIKELDKSVAERRKKLQEQINSVFDEADKTRKVVSEIWDIIDDKKAEEKYYEVNKSLEKVKALKKYITNDLVKDFDSVIQKIKDQIAKTTETINDIEKKGIIIENRTERIAEIVKQKELQAKIEADEESRTEDRKKRRSDRKAAFARDGAWHKMLGNAISDLASDSWTGIKDYFSKKATAPNK